MKFYTGIGARKTPSEILAIMTAFAKKMSEKNFILRSGGAEGADQAFEKGAGKLKEIYLSKDATKESKALAKKFHPAWNVCDDFTKNLHGRSSFQVLGKDLNTPSNFVVCWTPDGCISHDERSISTGGTGTAISIASDSLVPVFNLIRQPHLKRILKFINDEKISPPKAICIRPPWAYLVALGIKPVENRVWKSPYRGPLLIHSGDTWDAEGAEWILFTFPELAPIVEEAKKYRKCIIGRVNMVDCVSQHNSKWFFGPHGFVFENPVLFKEPVPFPGQQRIFSVPEKIFERCHE